MPSNLSNIDRAVRMIAGTLMIALALGLHDTGNLPQSSVWWGWFGVIPLASAFFGWCPFYQLFGIQTPPQA